MAKPAPRSPALTLPQRLLLEQAVSAGPVPELKFCPDRRFRIDVAFPDPRLAVEIQGGGWIHGKHSRGAGLENDAEKSALLAIYGWRLIYVTPRQIETGEAWLWIRAALAWPEESEALRRIRGGERWNSRA